MIEVVGEVAGASALTVHVAILGPIDPPPAPPALVVSPAGPLGDDPLAPKALHLAQRAHRALVQHLDQEVVRGGPRPRLRVVLHEPGVAAVDLGRRLAAYDVTWVDDPGDPAPPVPDGDTLDLVAPDEPAVAARLGRALADRALRACRVRAPGREEVGLELVAATLAYGAPPTPARLARDEARFARQEGRPGDAYAALRRLVELGADTADVALERADLARQLRDPDTVRVELDGVVALAGDDAALRARAAVVAADAGLRLLALRLAEAALEVDPGHPLALGLAYETRTELGRTREAIVALVAALPQVTDPGAAATLRLKLARTHLAPRDDDGALAWALDGLALRPDHPDLLDVRAEAGARLARPESEAWIAAAQPHTGARVAAARLAAAGLPERAAAVADAAPEARAEAAHLALWRLDLDRAEALAAAVAAERPDDADAELVRGAVAVLRGEPGVGVRHLDRALLLHGRGLAGPLLDDDTILAWRSEAWRGLGDAVRARADGSAAMTAARRYSVCAHLARVLGATLPHPDDPPDRGVDAYLVQPVASKVRSLVADPERLDGGAMATIHVALGEALARFGGNRTCWPTLVAQGRLVPFDTPPHPRAEGRRIQMRLKTRDPAEVLADLAALRGRFPSDPITRTYSGETLLWLGDYPAAEALLREAIRLERETVWAWIGLGAARMLQGALDEALAVWREGVAAVDFEGPTLFVYRAECRWRLGDLDRAAKGLDHALRDKPHRASSWVLRALVEADRGASGPAARVAATLRAHAPGAWEDAALAAGVDPWRADDAAADVAALRALLGLMRGNRSSSQAGYVLADGRLRTFAWPRKVRPADVFR